MDRIKDQRVTSEAVGPFAKAGVGSDRGLICPECKKVFNRDKCKDKLCPFCNKELKEIKDCICQKCSSTVSLLDKFCINCGSKFE